MASKKDKQTEALDNLFPAKEADPLLAAGEASIEKGVTEPVGFGEQLAKELAEADAAKAAEAECEGCEEVGPPITVEEAIKLLDTDITAIEEDLREDVEIAQENIKSLAEAAGDCVEHCKLLAPLHARVERLKSAI